MAIPETWRSSRRSSTGCHGTRLNESEAVVDDREFVAREIDRSDKRPRNVTPDFGRLDGEAACLGDPWRDAGDFELLRP
jgi:hypothetical protein